MKTNKQMIKVQEPIVRFMIVRQSGSPVADYPNYARAKKVLDDLKKCDSHKIIKLVQDMDFEGDSE
tara:strand:- start:146 stop:343 length:198 start_codon:yes stop_codon:yes gene_type:complete